MSRNKQIEMHELAKQMSEAISTAVEQRYIKDEAKLEAVLRANGWCKVTDVAREIFEEIEKATGEWGCYCITTSKWGYLTTDVHRTLAELKKKYLGEDINVPTKRKRG